METLVKKIEKDGDISFFVKKMLLHNRYKNLKKQLEKLSPLYEEFHYHHCFKLIRDVNLESFQQRSLEFLEKQATHFQSIPKDIRNINLANFFEELSAWAVGAENVIAFLEHCF